MRCKIGSLQLVVPRGFWTDFASVPSMIWPIMNPYDLGRAPVLHDFLYFTGYDGDRKVCDNAFLAGMEVDNIAYWKRKAAYWAVRMFGGPVWGRYRAENKKYKLVMVERAFRITNWTVEKEDWYA
jgi:hypothetical protein